jgi:hypothetical protein
MESTLEVDSILTPLPDDSLFVGFEPAEGFFATNTWCISRLGKNDLIFIDEDAIFIMTEDWPFCHKIGDHDHGCCAGGRSYRNI